jgi:hypothetical protein
MSSVKITELSSSGPLTGSEVLPIVQGNQTVKTTVQEIGSFTRPYKVYTALLTQSGGDDPLSIDSGLLTIGVTYYINNNSSGMDFTNVGAPNNIAGESTYFIATGTTPNSWGAGEGTGNGTLSYNTGAPVVTVLENTIGNIWFTYDMVGRYNVNSDGLFTTNKTYSVPYVYSPLSDLPNGIFIENLTVNYSQIISIYNADTVDNQLSNTSIEIRVYE